MRSAPKFMPPVSRGNTHQHTSLVPSLPVAYYAGLKPATGTIVPSSRSFAPETWQLWQTPQEGLWEISYCRRKTKNHCVETEGGKNRVCQYEGFCNSVSQLYFLNEFITHYRHLPNEYGSSHTYSYLWNFYPVLSLFINFLISVAKA